MATLTEVLQEMAVDPAQLMQALKWAEDDATKEAVAAAATAAVTGRMGELRAQATAGRLALVAAVTALVHLEARREEEAAERQALVAADLANSAEREASAEPA